MEKSDYVFANLETPISLDNHDLTTEEFCFYSPYEFAKAVKEAGIDFVATANNHCLDRGIPGIISTINSLEKLGINHTGTFSDAGQRENPCLIQIGSLRIGILSYTYGTNAFSNHQYLNNSQKYSVNLFQNQELSNPIDRYFYYHRKKITARIYNKIIEKICPGQIKGPIYEHRELNYLCKKRCIKDICCLKEDGADLIVMYMHAGGQYNDKPTKYTKELTEWLLCQGVDIVAGSHEHVVHGGIFERLEQGKLATYSLGNFDGIAGVYANPMDKMAEYSIAWHVYVDENGKMQRTTFTILKTILSGERRIQVVPCVDLLKNPLEKNRERLLEDMEKISYIFSGKNIKRSNVENNLELEIL